MSHTDADRLAFDPLWGDEADIKLRTVRIRTARKEHPCFGAEALPNGDGHTIKPGERYRHDRALIDGDFWGNYRICLSCCDKWLDEIKGETDEDEDEDE